ncbi:MAG: hypothetical protein PHV11_02635 [Candidatus Bipolaricaulis sp.]|nr:hypothetical protein [Candidatus Bipolaricaulis sp.]MDD5219450.1 hypothetical protein [Candidatus Bipolaricaulis sp.]
MNVTVLEEHGYASALLGLSLSYRQDPERMSAVARRLCSLGEGHNKYLESIVVWLDMTAPRYFWQQFDTYRIGVTKQSESTMHTLTSRPLGQDDFARPVPDEYLAYLNDRIATGDWEGVKAGIPESFQQRRVVCLNYMVLRRMIRQRRTHRLPEWPEFVEHVLASVEHAELLEDEGRS